MIEPISYSSVLYLAHNMREADRLEIFNTLDHDSPDKLAREICLATAFGKAGIAFRGRPTGIVGVSPIRHGVWSIWAFGTNEWRRGVTDLMRFANRDLREFLMRKGAHRMQCESRIDHVDAHKWLELCGAKREGILRGFGRDGSDYIQFSWTRDDANVLLKTAGTQACTATAG